MSSYGSRSQHVAKERGSRYCFRRVLGKVRGGGGPAVGSAGVVVSALSVQGSSSVESLAMDTSSTEESARQPANVKGLRGALLGVSEHDG